MSTCECGHSDTVHAANVGVCRFCDCERRRSDVLLAALAAAEARVRTARRDALREAAEALREERRQHRRRRETQGYSYPADDAITDALFDLARRLDRLALAAEEG